MRHPLVSLALLFGAYTVFSWYLYSLTVPTVVWLLVLVLVLVQALLLTAWSRSLRRFSVRWLKSDLGYFSAILLVALSVVFALVWHRIFQYVLMVVASEILARLDLQNCGLNRWQTLLVLTLVSAVGLAVGWTATFTLNLLGEV